MGGKKGLRIRDIATRPEEQCDTSKVASLANARVMHRGWGGACLAVPFKGFGERSLGQNTIAGLRDDAGHGHVRVASRAGQKEGGQHCARHAPPMCSLSVGCTWRDAAQLSGAHPTAEPDFAFISPALVVLAKDVVTGNWSDKG